MAEQKQEVMAIRREIKIPEGVEVRLENEELVVKGPKGELRRVFSHPRVRVEVADGVVSVISDSTRRKDKAIVGTWVSHIKNMMYGVVRGFQAKLKIVYTHFPMNVKQEGDYIIISNFMGEKGIRKAKIFGNVTVKIDKEEITVEGINIEEVGQTAANIEQACKYRANRDPRIFFDGIYIYQKPKRSDDLWQ